MQRAIALFDCRADAADELSFNKDDELIEVIKVAEGWFMATNKQTGLKGHVPENYINLLPLKSAPPPLPSKPAPSTLSPPVLGHSRQSSQVSNASTEFTPTKQFKNLPSFMSAKEFYKYLDFFNREDTDQDGYLNPNEVKKVFSLSNQPKDFLGQIWVLSDYGKDGRLSAAEFVIGMWLIGLKVRDQTATFQLPSQLESTQIRWIKEFESEFFSGTQNHVVKPSPSSGSVNALSSSFNTTGAIKTQPEPPIKEETSEAPSKFEIFKFSRSDKGQELASTTADFAKTDTGKAVAGAAWENKDTIVKAAQSETGKKVLSAAWENRDKVANAAVSGMKTAAKFA